MLLPCVKRRALVWSGNRMWAGELGICHMPWSLYRVHLHRLCVCVCISVWFVATCPMKSLCACMSLHCHLHVCVCIYWFHLLFLVKYLYTTTVCVVKCVYVLVSYPLSCVGFFSRHSTMHGIPTGTVLGPPWKSRRQAARLSVSLSLSLSVISLSSRSFHCGSVVQYQNKTTVGTGV